MNRAPPLPADPPPAVPSRPARTPLYVMPTEPAPRFKVVLVAPRRLPGWLLRFLELATEHPWLELVVLPIAGESEVPTHPTPLDVRALLAYEGRRKLGTGLALVEATPQDGIAFELAIPHDLDTAEMRATVGALRPDLVLLVGAAHWAEALGDRAEWGCWEFGRNLTDAVEAAQALLSPVMRGEVATAVELQLHHLDRPPTPLAAGWSSTCRASASAQRERAFLRMPGLLMRSLRKLANGELPVPSQRTARLQLAPAPTRWGAGVLTFARTLAFRLATRRRARSNDEAWHILLRQGAAPIDPDAPDIRQSTFLSAPGNRFWADPCLTVHAGRRLLFVEQWAEGDTKGVIACVELAETQARPLGVVLEHPFHLSYPQVFRWEDQWYLTVESGQDKCVRLYRAEAFPLRWQHVTNLVSGWGFVDPTLHYHDHRWYLFANVGESGGSSCDELFLFVAERLEGPYRPHPANPVVNDVRRARPAGRLFQRDGRLVRPAQDCAPRYGAAVVFNEVLELSPTHYRERPLGRLDTRWTSGLDGCHTYNEAAGVEVLDARGTPPRNCDRLPAVETTGVDEATGSDAVGAYRKVLPVLAKT
ncbi:hypothetical protein ACFQZQ_01150 [Lysobacter koreensis]|uniref:Glucosamine inositolphosphorylceramide transferase 1 N-terminal domain-containing protein n=1 Tax=Lysobacter koreensis TaxID=266122 RepID=A0ABW2YN49_9GAMM